MQALALLPPGDSRAQVRLSCRSGNGRRFLARVSLDTLLRLQAANPFRQILNDAAPDFRAPGLQSGIDQVGFARQNLQGIAALVRSISISAANETYSSP